MRLELGFAPAGRVLGIGSLPHEDPEEAVACVARHCREIPFWPQLPKRAPEEGFLRHHFHAELAHLDRDPSGVGYRLPASRAEAFGASLAGRFPETFTRVSLGFEAFLRGFEEGAFPDAKAVKTQLSGPVTLSGMIRDESGGSLRAELLDGITSSLGREIRWQMGVLRHLDRPVLVFLDEPGLFALEEEEKDREVVEHALGCLERLFGIIREEGAWPGLHSCARFPYSWVARTRPDVFSFNAHEGLETFVEDPAGSRFLDEGGTLALGLVPTDDPLDGLDLDQLATRVLDTLGGERVAQGFVSATCGLGTLTTETAERTFEVAAALSRKMSPEKRSTARSDR